MKKLTLKQHNLYLKEMFENTFRSYFAEPYKFDGKIPSLTKDNFFEIKKKYNKI